VGNSIESRAAAALRRCTTERAQDDDDGLGAWCVAMGLHEDGTPLNGMEAAKRAQAAMLADERKQAETPRYKIPFWKLPFARDL
jgi:hypothetical protein